MKDIGSLLVMSRSSESDLQSCSDMTLEMDLVPSAGVTHIPMNQIPSLDNSSHINLMDWAECLIELTLTTDQASSEEQINSLTRISNSERWGTTLTETNAGNITTIIPSASSDVNKVENISPWQETFQDDGSTHVDIFLNSASQENLTNSTNSTILPSSNSLDIFYPHSDICTTSGITSLCTNEDIRHLDDPSVNTTVTLSCLNSDFISLRTKQHLSLAEVETTTLTSYSPETDIFIEGKVPRSLAPDVNSDKFILDSSVSFPNVSNKISRPDNFGIKNIQPAVTTASISAFNFSLNTPIFETLPVMKNSPVLGVTLDSVIDQYQSLSSADASHTIDSTNSAENSSWTVQSELVKDGESSMPDIDVATVEIISSENISSFPLSLQSSWDNHLVSSVDCSGAVTVSQQDNASCAWAEDNHSNNQIFIASKNDQFTVDTSFQLCAHQTYVDTPLHQNVSSEIDISNLVVDDVTLSSCSRTFEINRHQKDFSGLKVVETWSPTFVSSTEPVEFDSNISHINKCDHSTFDDFNAIHDYCLNASSRSGHYLSQDVTQLTVSRLGTISQTGQHHQQNFKTSRTLSDSTTQSNSCVSENSQTLSDNSNDTVPCRRDVLARISSKCISNSTQDGSNLKRRLISQDESSDDNDDEISPEEEDVSSPSASKKRCSSQEKYDEDDDELSEGTRLAKREKNRLAAQKCRRRKSDKIEMLTQQVERLESKQERIKREVDKLEIEREHLQEMLRLHSFVCKNEVKVQVRKHR